MFNPQKIISYFNPMDHLGEGKYSYKFPFFVTLLSCISIEVYVHILAKSTANVGTLAILIPFALIIYFSFRDGIKGGVATSGVTIVYYFYLIFALHYTGQQYKSGVITTIILGILYVLLSAIIGGLKQRIDWLMEQERHARYIAEEGKLRLHTILQQLPVGVLIANAKTGKFEANKQMEKIIGKKIKNSITRSATYLSPFASRLGNPLAPHQWPIVRALANGEVVSEEEIEYIREDKKRLFLRVNAAPIKGLHGEIIAAVSTLYDFTQVKELEMRKDDFVNMASHELKTPITSITLYVDSLIRKIKNYEDENIKKIAYNIQAQTERLQKLVNDLLDVSRLQTGKLSYSKEKFRLDTFISELITQLEQTTSQKIVLTHGVPAVVFADPFRISQVLTNLLANAIKYSQGKREITISLYKKKGKVLCSIKDFGIGVARDQQEKIFDRLYQVNDDTAKTFPGFGMGLFISREIVQKHKGEIWVKSKEGKGSTFYFSLPLVKGGKKKHI